MYIVIFTVSVVFVSTVTSISINLPNLKVELGGDCLINVSDGHNCKNGLCILGTCKLGTLADPCKSDDDCYTYADLYCDTDIDKCSDNYNHQPICTKDSDCRSGMICETLSSRCALKGVPQCKSKDDCKNINEECIITLYGRICSTDYVKCETIKCGRNEKCFINTLGNPLCSPKKVLAKLGKACNVTTGVKCESNLVCSSGKCALPAKLGKACNVNNGLICEQNLLCSSGKCIKLGVLGDACTDDIYCEEELHCDKRINICSDNYHNHGICDKDSDCNSTSLVCETLSRQCFLKSDQPQCKSNDECPDIYQDCVLTPVYGRICQVTRHDSCDNKCGPNEKCSNYSGPAICSCAYPYRGTSPNCTLKCASNYDCFGQYACRNKKCVHACEGKCKTILNLTPLVCFASNHGYSCQL